MMTTACSFLSSENHPPSRVISFIQSQKGKPFAYVPDEYIFKLNKTTTTSKYWIFAHTACSAKKNKNILVKIFPFGLSTAHLLRYILFYYSQF